MQAALLPGDFMWRSLADEIGPSMKPTGGNYSMDLEMYLDSETSLDSRSNACTSADSFVQRLSCTLVGCRVLGTGIHSIQQRDEAWATDLLQIDLL